MLSEFGITHDVFRASSYSSPEVCDLHLRNLMRVLLDRALVRNLRQGDWQNFFKERIGEWEPRAKQLVKQLVEEKRLKLAPAANLVTPTGDADWCREAIASNARNPLDGIITTRSTADAMAASDAVSPVENLEHRAWWNDERQSVHLRRRTEDYLRVLAPVVAKANLLMFIDAHLDPSRPGYAGFAQIVSAAQRSDGCPPLIEFHRVCYSGQGRDRRLLAETDLRSAFHGLDGPLKSAGLTATVFVWDDFHDRFLITDLIGILMGNGFDASRDVNQRTTWARISREERTRIQRDFDPANSPCHQLRMNFTVGTP